MTNKLKKRVKGITASLMAATAGICAAIVLSTDVFVMPTNEENRTTAVTEATLSETIDGTSETAMAKSGIQTISETATVSVAEGDIIECESIVQGARDNNLPNGNYKFRVKGKNSAGNVEILDYPVEIINYYDDVHYTSGQTVSLGDSSTTYKMLIVKYHKNLTIDAGATVTATNVSSLTYKKGMYLCVLGELTNNGTISMTARGTYNQAGENVYLWKNLDNTYEFVPAVGGAGAARVRRKKCQCTW